MRFSTGMLGMLALAPLSGHAVLIEPDTSPQVTGTETSQAAIDTAIEDELGDSIELYKADVGGTDSGAFAASYTTTFSNTESDPSDALIEWTVEMPTISDATHLLVKDGNQEPAWYLFEFDWDGMEDIQLQGFWPEEGAISHVTIYGGGDGDRTVPEPGTLSLFGAGLLLFGYSARRRRKVAA